MKKQIVIRDKNGVCINIGPWNHMVSYDDDGNQYDANPLPEGATSAEEDIVTLPDGGLAAAE